MRRLIGPAALTLTLVTIYVALAGWNRSGEPRLMLTVTERELSLPYNPSPAPGEDPGLQLAIEFERRIEALDSRNWLTEDRLRALGFGLNVPLGAPEAATIYGRALPRVAWVAFEYGGAAWREIERRRAVRESTQPYRAVMEPSRLVPVDAALAFDELQARYPRDHLILRAVIALSYDNPQDSAPVVYGYLRELVPATVAVPRHLRPVLEGLSPPTYSDGSAAPQPVAPRYEVDLAVGRLGIPYIRGLRRLGM